MGFSGRIGVPLDKYRLSEAMGKTDDSYGACEEKCFNQPF